MAWTTAYTFVANSILTAAQMNTNVKDNTTALHTGAFELASQLTGDWMQASSATQWSRVRPYRPLLLAGYTPASNGTTVETDLMGLSLVAGLLGTDGWGLEVVAAVACASSANAKTVRFKLGTTTVFSISMPTNQAYSQVIRVTILRVTGTSQIIAYEITGPPGIGAIVTSSTATCAETMANALALKFTGQGGASSEITQLLMTVGLIRVP